MFETLDDLDNSTDAMQRLLSNEWYRAHINGEQEVMIGYSDSGKDAGRMAAAWGLYEVQESLVNVAKVCTSASATCVCVCQAGRAVKLNAVNAALMSQLSIISDSDHSVHLRFCAKGSVQGEPEQEPEPKDTCRDRQCLHRRMTSN